ncbi:uncharacterized protein LOC134854103 [Symsagittifera roscoffensis]|uniref:uncharacterized protein LOC134854103 n=1 Tax=Symsagittifera roscoffensis TaxID=84072 RepID=UPI00307C84B3
MSKFNKTVSALDHFTSDKNMAQSKVLLMGMKGSGKTLFRESCYDHFGDEKEKADKFADVDSKRVRSEMMARTCATLTERDYVDIAFKRFDPEDYEWEDKKVKVHFCEPGFDFRMEKEFTPVLNQINCLAIFLDCTKENVDDYDLNIHMPFLRKNQSVPPLAIIYNSKGQSESRIDRSKIRNYIGFDSLVAAKPFQILEVEVKDLKNLDDVTSVINACLRQGLLRDGLSMPKPNPRVVARDTP